MSRDAYQGRRAAGRNPRPEASRKGHSVSYSVAVSEEALGPDAAVVLQGGVEAAMTRAAAMGYDAVEVHIRNPELWDAALLQQWSRRHGIAISALGTGLEYSRNGLSFTHPDSGVRSATVRQFLRYIDLAAPFHAVVFLGLCRGAAPSRGETDAYLYRFAEAVAPVAEYARKRDVVLGLEPIAPYMTNLLTTTAEALEFTRRPGLESIDLLLDTHHMDREEAGVAGALEAAAGRIAHIHVSDRDRKAPGSGGIDFDSFGRALTRSGYDRAVSLEVLPLPSEDDAALRGINWMRSVWGE